MELKKAVIEVLGVANKDGAKINNKDDLKVEVLFNPKEYSIEKSAQWKEKDGTLADNPDIEFTTGQRKRLSMELFFDTSDEKTDVRVLTRKIEDLMLVHPDVHRPPILMFSWGPLQFKCVLEDLSSRFTMFDSEGVPLRAILKVLFKEYNPIKDQAKRTHKNSADHTKRLMLREGETLQSLSAREYGSPKHWRLIADSNGVEDPMNIKSGTLLRLPPLF